MSLVSGYDSEPEISEWEDYPWFAILGTDVLVYFLDFQQRRDQDAYGHQLEPFLPSFYKGFLFFYLNF